MNPQEFINLQKRVSEFQREADKAQGSLEQVKKELVEEFGCKTSKQTKELVDTITSEIDELKEKKETLVKEFEEEFGERLP